MTEYIKTFSCPTCGAPASGSGHLCHPREDAEPFKCEFCGKKTSDARHICSKMLGSIEYTCKKCGRLAIYDTMLCEPEPIDAD